MKIKLDDLKKLEASSIQPHLQEENGKQIQAIVKVKKAHYVPTGVKVRSQIDPHLFTADMPTSLLTLLESDKDVVSVSVAKNLHPLS